MAGDKIFQARRKLRHMAKASLLKMAFSQKEKLCLLGGGPCPFLLEYQRALFCVSETLGHGCQIERSEIPSDEGTHSREESPRKAAQSAVGPCLPGLG
jgi:hypothetical protein